MVKLSICIDQVAILRNIANRGEPDPMTTAIISQVSGADAITVSWLSNAEIYIGNELDSIRRLVHTHLNLITTPDLERLQSILTISPDMVTLVPVGYTPQTLSDKWSETSWPEDDLLEKPIERMVKELQENKILTNILIRPEAIQVRQCSELRMDYVHIDVSSYIHEHHPEEKKRVIDEISSATKMSARLNMGVSIGRGVDYRTLADLLTIPEIEEVVVGYPVAVRAMTIGYERAVRDMVDIIRHVPRKISNW